MSWGWKEKLAYRKVLRLHMRGNRRIWRVFAVNSITEVEVGVEMLSL